jgi:enoyl-CoA hydratase/carnithine racemase
MSKADPDRRDAPQPAEASGAPLVLREIHGGVFRITLNRPDQRNALNDEAAALIAEALRDAQADPAVRAIVLTGAGDRAFCAGGDLKAGSQDSPFEVDPAHPGNPIIELFKTFEQTTKPTIARVNGHALAGGLGLMCACDIAIAVEGATFGVPETGVGLFPMMILPYLMRAMPRRRLLEWCITGARWSAAEAERADLLNRVVPADELDAAVDELLATIVARSPTAIRLGKTGLHAIEDMTLAQAFEYAQLMLPNMARTQDAIEGFRAFREKRPPRFEGN